MRSFAYTLTAIAVGIVSALASTSRADLVVGYDAADPGIPSSLGPIIISGSGVTGGMLSRGAGLDYESGGGVDFNSSKWTNDPDDPDLADALLFSFTSTTAYDLTTLEIRGQSSSDGPMTFRLQVDLGQVNVFTTVGSDFVLPQNTATTLLFDLSPLTGVTSAAFRLLGFNADNSGDPSQFRILDAGDFIGEADLVVNGTVAAVPEPSAVLCGALVCGVIAVGAAKRRFTGGICTGRQQQNAIPSKT
jgi:hypothetical protein